MTVEGEAPAPGRRTGGHRGRGAAREDGAVPLPTVAELRAVLRPPRLPLPTPRTAREAAHRVEDCLAAGRPDAALRVAIAGAGEPGSLADRLQLLALHADALDASGEAERARQVREEAVALLAGAGFTAQARASARSLRADAARSAAAEPAGGRAVDPGGGAAAGVPAVAAESAASGRTGRRRAPLLEMLTAEEPDDAEEIIGVVLRGMAVPAILQDASATPAERDELERREGALIGALEACTAVPELILGDPLPLLRVRYAQLLLATDRPEEAAVQADGVLHRLGIPAGAGSGSTREAGTSEAPGASAASPSPAPGASAPSPAPASDLHRAGTQAREVLARAPRRSDPHRAARHAVDALADLLDVDVPARRVAVMTDLLRDLLAAGAEREAAVTADRLDSLQRTLRRSEDRTQALLAVAEQRIRAGRDKNALVPLLEVQRIAARRFDHRAGLAAARMLADAHRRAGRIPEALADLRRAAGKAFALTEDLAAPPSERARHLRAELSARAGILELALEAGDLASAREEAKRVLKRTAPTGGRPVLPAAVLWERAVDARLVLLEAAGREAAARTSAEGDSEGERPAAGAGAPGRSPSAIAADPPRRNLLQKGGRGGPRRGARPRTAPGAPGSAPGSIGAPTADLARLAAEAAAEIERAPEGSSRRMLFRRAELAERESALLAAAGDPRGALERAEAAREGWSRIGEQARSERAAAEIGRLRGDA